MDNKLDTISKNISKFISNWLGINSGFSVRSFYGESFSLLLLKQNGKLKKELFSILLKNYDDLDKNAPNFHFEFNNYAFNQFLKLENSEEIRDRLFPLKFKNTSCTNWTLLRSCTRIQLGIDMDIARNEAIRKIDDFQLENGLILDDIGVKSFQYHCFSMSMIGEIFIETRDPIFLESFNNGVKFIRNFILPNGNTLYVGRGQEQSFGYATLIYVLSLYYQFSGDKSVLPQIKSVTSFLKKYQDEDGSLALVMNSVDNLSIGDVDLMDPKFAGWYAYNNYFDYLPFAGVFLHKAAEILKGSKVDVYNSNNDESDYRDKHFVKIVTNNYISILSKPGGYWTNDLPIPYIYSKGQSITPCYGGEQFAPSLNSEEAIPLPYFSKIKKSIRWRSISFFLKDNLILISPLGLMLRKYTYEEKEINIITYVLSVFSFTQNIATRKNLEHFLEIKSKPQLKPKEGEWISPNGYINLYFTNGFKQSVTFQLR